MVKRIYHFCVTLLCIMTTTIMHAQRKAAPNDFSNVPRPLSKSVPNPPGVMSTILLQENFSSASGSTPPAGWSNNTIQGLPTDIWRFDNPGNRNVSFNATQPAAVFDSDFLSQAGDAEIVTLESPTFSAPLNSNITLKFRQFFRSNPTGTKAVVDAFDGIRWVVVDSNRIQTTDPDTAIMDLTPHVAGVGNARIRFRFMGNWSWWWFVDDIVITETPIAPSTRLIFETFRTATGSTPPIGWTINRMVGQSYDVWRFDNPASRTILPPLAPPVAIFDSDSLSELGGPEDVALESPTFNAPSNATIKLRFNHFFRGDSGGRATVEVFNGTTWNAIWDSVHSTRNPDTLSLDITNYVSGVSNAKVRFRWRGWWSWWWIVDNIIVTQTPNGGGNVGIISDQFNATSLNTSVWTFSNPRNDASYSMTGTQLSIQVPAGRSHDITELGNHAPRVMQDVSNPQTFEVYVKFDGLMNQAYQTQGIQIWEDSLNFLRLEFYGDGLYLNRLAWSFVNGVHQEQGTAGLGISPTAPIYMKITRNNDTWTQLWSTDGLNYNIGTSFARTMNVTKIGVYAGNVGFPESTAPAFTGLFDYFLSFDPLPIQLGRFVAIATSASSVRLEWTTISETNNFGFEVQKSRSSTENFQSLPNSFVPGNGTTITPHNYSWTDNQAEGGRWFYRLKQIDLDGTISYTDPVAVDILTGVDERTAPRQFSLSQNYPNPFNPSTEIKFSVEVSGKATLEVFNVIGQRVATLFDDVAEAGQIYRVQFKSTDAASGMYLYKLTSGTRSELKRMLLLK